MRSVQNGNFAIDVNMTLGCRHNLQNAQNIYSCVQVRVVVQQGANTIRIKCKLQLFEVMHPSYDSFGNNVPRNDTNKRVVQHVRPNWVPNMCEFRVANT